MRRVIRHHKSLRNTAKGSLRLVWPVAYASNENRRRSEDTTKTAYFVEPQPSFKETPQIEFIRVLNTLGVISNPITRENFHTHTQPRTTVEQNGVPRSGVYARYICRHYGSRLSYHVSFINRVLVS